MEIISRVDDRKNKRCGTQNDPPARKIKRLNPSTDFNPNITYSYRRSVMEAKENRKQNDEDECCVVAEIPLQKHNRASRRLDGKSQQSASTSAENAWTSVKTCPFLSVDQETEDVKIIKHKTNGSKQQNKFPSIGKYSSLKKMNSTLKPISRFTANKIQRRNSSTVKKMSQDESWFVYKTMLSQFVPQDSPQCQPNHLAQFTIPRKAIQPPQPVKKSDLQVIDLTNDVEDKSLVLWTPSQEPDPEPDVQIVEEPPSLNPLNTLAKMFRANSICDKDECDNKIVSKPTPRSPEKALAIEWPKTDVFEYNKTSYRDGLQKKLQTYRRIPPPDIEEIDEDLEVLVGPGLTKQQEAKIEAALKLGATGQVLVEKFGLRITGRDMQTLNGLNWLNDEIINFYMNLIAERSKKRGLPNVYAFNTFFYPTLISRGYERLKRWTKKVDLFSYDIILVPIHLGMHWCMAALDFRRKEISYYDSMGTPSFRCLRALLSYLEAESRDKRNRLYDTSDWKMTNAENIPPQMNGSDCGVFSCVFAEYLARDAPFLFSQENMPFFRRKMVLEILETRLLT